MIKFMNETIFYFFYNLAHRSEIFDKLIIFFAFYFPYIVIILAGLFLLFHHDVFKAENPYQVFLQKKKEILMVFITSGFAWILAKLLKIFIQVDRPFTELSNIDPLILKTDFAFPSGHATFFMALAVCIFLLHKKAGYVFMLLALFIGIARIIAGVHFPVDILGGFILGGVIAYFVKMYRMK